MDTSNIKRFATEARVSLKQGVINRIAMLGFDAEGHVADGMEPQLASGSTIFNGRVVEGEQMYHQWMALRSRIDERGIRDVYEEAASTWFNIFMAIRILYKNGIINSVLEFANSAIRVPKIVEDARKGMYPEMPMAQKHELMELLNDDTKVFEQFQLLIVAYCNANPIIRSCFIDGITQYVELLLPTNILAEGNLIDWINHSEFITDEDYTKSELIGWLYQFYIAEKKDEVFASFKNKKADAEDIPAATQIFTPNWIVKYMVENSLGRIYLDSHPDSPLQSDMHYLVNDNTQRPVLDINLEDMRCADISCGSGHILGEMFEMLFSIYQEELYSPSEAIELIFNRNLVGVDLDTRAKQLSMFALLLKACQRDNSFADAHCLPHVLDMPQYPFHGCEDDAIMAVLHHYFRGEEAAGRNAKTYRTDLLHIFHTMEHADTLGSIMKFRVSEDTRYLVQSTYNYWQGSSDIPEYILGAHKCFALFLVLTDHYSSIAMNPPYMGSGNMNATLAKYVKDNYPRSKADLFSVFMDVAIDRLMPNGKYGMLNMHSWMFLSSFEELRRDLLEHYSIDSLLHLGPRTFDELSGEVVQNAAFVITKNSESTSGKYYRLVSGANCHKKELLYLDRKYEFETIQKQFLLIPECPIGYWIRPTLISAFSKKILGEEASPRRTLQCGNVDRFIRSWHEVSFSMIEKNTDYDYLVGEQTNKWFKFTNGGSARKWYGNLDSVVVWGNNGEEIKATGKAIIANENLYLQGFVGYNRITSNGLSARQHPMGVLAGDATSMLDPRSANQKFFLALLNSYVSGYLMQLFNPSLAAQTGSVAKLPVVYDRISIIDDLVDNSVDISKKDWDQHETSWDFKINELAWMASHAVVLDGRQEDLALPIASLLDSFKEKWAEKFHQLHKNEEELNRQFIEIYGLQEELTPDVPLSDVTILQQGEISIENNALVWHDDVLIKQFISYAVGCMMGRFSIDKEGLILANQGDGIEEFNHLVPNTRFMPDNDGIIPMLPSHCPFNDNIVIRLADFVNAVFGADIQLQNLNYIEQCLGKTVEQYFLKDFWKDHKRMYQNRPIYWLFSSKKGAFQCIVYMHRMNRFTVEQIRNEYLLPYISYLESSINNLVQHESSLNSTERAMLKRLRADLQDCEEYHLRLHAVADKQIDFDLDDGVIKNYALFGDVVAPIK